MNILLVVMTFLMVLTLMTYSRIESYRDSQAVQAQFEHSMQGKATEYPSAIAKKWYQKNPAEKKKTGEDKDETERQKEYANSRVSFFLFFNKKQREQQQAEFEQLLLLTKFLMQELYGNAPFFQEAQDKNPNILDDLMKTLIEKTEDLPKGEKIVYPKDLATVDLGDQELNDLFYHMLKGGEEGYPSLLDYITVKNKTQINVYLAPKGLLNAIYNDPDTVQYLIASRNELYTLIKGEQLEPEAATNQLQTLFGGKQRSALSAALINFNVSKSNPKDFE